MTDIQRMLIELSQNMTLLISLTFLYGLCIRKLSSIHKLQLSALNGVLFGMMALIGMQVPMHVADGIIVDGRTVIVMLASPFAGNLAGLVAGGIVSLFRLYLGGVGAIAGIGAIATATAVGMVFSYYLRLPAGNLKVKHLLSMSVIMTIFSLLWVFALPANIDALAILKRLIVPVSILYPLASILLGLLLVHEFRYLDLVSVVKDSERRFRSLFDNVGISIWNEDLSDLYDALNKLRDEGVVDLRNHLNEREPLKKELAHRVKIIGVNKATLKLFGTTSKDDLFGHIDDTFVPGTMDVFVDELCAIWDHEKTFRAEASFKSLDGRYLSVFITFQIPTTRDGFKCVPVSLIDVTERRLLEEKIRRSQKMEAVGQLTGGISHDFNNLLGIIQGNLELLSEMLLGNKDALKRIETAQRSVTRGAEITKKLLGFSRENSEHVHLTSLNTFIDSLEDLIAKSLTASINVETHLASNLWQVTTDPGDLENAILNLALNARDAMPDGGSLYIETANKTLDKHYVARNPDSKAGDFVMISISDNGVGMTPEIREKILEPFFSTKEIGKGTGLGLSMVYGFVQRSGGHLKVYSELGIGTTIRLYLPRAVGKVANQNIKNDAATSLPRGRETILIVDDEDALLDIAENYLRALGYKTLIAESGTKALEVLDENDNVDLLFSDIIMTGGLDGYQLASEVTKQYPALKILLTSGFSQNDATIAHINGKHLNQLSNDILEKPYNMSELAVALRQTLDQAS